MQDTPSPSYDTIYRTEVEENKVDVPDILPPVPALPPGVLYLPGAHVLQRTKERCHGAFENTQSNV